MKLALVLCSIFESEPKWNERKNFFFSFLYERASERLTQRDHRPESFWWYKKWLSIGTWREFVLWVEFSRGFSCVYNNAGVFFWGQQGIDCKSRFLGLTKFFKCFLIVFHLCSSLSLPPPGWSNLSFMTRCKLPAFSFHFLHIKILKLKHTQTQNQKHAGWVYWLVLG